MNNKKVFSVQLFIHNFLQLKLVGILGTVVITAFLAFSLISTGMDVAQVVRAGGKVMIGDYAISITGSKLSALLATYAIVTPILTLMAFNFNNRRNSSDFYNSLPYTRLNLYLTNIAAVMAWVVIMFVAAIIAISGSIGAYHEYFVYSKATIAWFVLGMFVANFVCCASISIACALTGNLISNICLSALIMFLPVLVRIMVIRTVETLFSYASSIQAVPFIGTEKNLVSTLVYRETFSNYGGFTGAFTDKGSIAYSIVLALIYFVIGYLLFVRRRSEIAGKASVGSKIQLAIRVILGFIVIEIAVICMLQIETTSVLFIVLMFMMAYITVFVYELLTGEKTSIFKKTVISYLIACGVAAVFTGVVALGTMSMKHYVAKADSISYVKIESIDTYYGNKNYYESKLSKLEITDEAVIKKLADSYNDCISGTVKGLALDESVYTVDVYFKDGLFGKRRSIEITSSEYQELLKKLSAVEDYQKIYLTFPSADGASFNFNNAVSLRQDDARKLYETLKEEIKSVDFTTYIKAYNNSNVCDKLYITFVEDGGEYTINIPFTTAVPKSTALFMELVNESNKTVMAGNIDYDDVKKLVTSILDDDKFYNIASLGNTVSSGNTVSGNVATTSGSGVDVDIIEINLVNQEQDYIYSKYIYGDDSEESSSTGKLTDENRAIISNALKSGNTTIDPTKTFYQVNVFVYMYTDDGYVRGYYYMYLQ